MNVFSKIAIISMIAFVPAAAVTQDSSASISGTVYGPDGETVPNAPIQVTNSVTNDYQRARSDANGEYQMTGLPAGSYTLTINNPCCTYGSFESEVIEIALDEAGVFDVKLQPSS